VNLPAVIKNDKTKVSYTVDKKIVEEFNKIADSQNLNKSRTVNNLIKIFIESNQK